MAVPDLEGELTPLRTLSAEDAGPLLATIDPEVWRWNLAPYPESVADMRRVTEENLVGGDRQPFLISRRTDRAALGSTTLYDFDARNQRVEMGWTWLARSAWGQGYNEDVKYQLLRHRFEVLKLERVAWRLDSLNRCSKSALERLGLTYEGCLRSHQLRPDGTRRAGRAEAISRRSAGWADPTNGREGAGVGELAGPHGGRSSSPAVSGPTRVQPQSRTALPGVGLTSLERRGTSDAGATSLASWRSVA